jgi:hypothetical protein
MPMRLRALLRSSLRALGVALFAGAGSYASPAAFSDGFVAAISSSAALSLLGVLAGAALPRRRAARSVTIAPALEAEG